MRHIVLLLVTCFPFISLAQATIPIEAPIGFLRTQPTVTAPIIYKIQENEKVKVLERINPNWSKVEYMHHSKPTIGYLTNQTLGEAKPVAKLRVMATDGK